MKVEIFSILDFNGNKNGNPEMLPLYLDHYIERFPTCIFNIYLSNYPDDYNGEEIKLLKAKDCRISTIELGNNIMYYNNLCNDLTQPEIVKSSKDLVTYIRKETELKNNIWKDSDADWIIICDIDELVQIKADDLKDIDSDVIKFKGYQMLRYNNESDFKELTCGYRDGQFDKTLMFRSTIDDINFTLGSHDASPVSKQNIKKSDKEYKLLHYKEDRMEGIGRFDTPVEVVKGIPTHPYPFPITERGWWIVDLSYPSYKTGWDEPLAKGLNSFFKEESVKVIADFGCGDGAFIDYFISEGYNMDGYDGNPHTSSTVADLSEPIVLDKKYEWIISFEVGEHIPKKYEDVFIQNLHNNNSKGLIITWATPNMLGFGHVNCREPQYIRDKFVKLNYSVDEEVTENLRNLCSKFWLANSLMVLRKN